MSADTEDAAALVGLDNLEAVPRQKSRPSASEIGGRVWQSLWPKLLAIAIVLGIWELVYLASFKPHVVLPGPGQVLPNLWDQLNHAQLWKAIGLTLQQAVVGFALALVVGTVVGLVVARVPPVRAAVGSMITGLQTIPSVVWIPFAIILFGNNTTAILFMVIITAAPSIANGLIAGVDFTPPLLLRAGKTMGLRRFGLYRSLVLPAALPSFVSGLKQGWAFAWHGLLAGELLVIVPNLPSIGVLLQSDQDQTDMAGVIALMIVILIVGVLVDGLLSTVNEALRRRRGLAQAPSTAKGWKLATGVARLPVRALPPPRHDRLGVGQPDGPGGHGRGSRAGRPPEHLWRSGLRPRTLVAGGRLPVRRGHDSRVRGPAAAAREPAGPDRGRPPARNRPSFSPLTPKSIGNISTANGHAERPARTHTQLAGHNGLRFMFEGFRRGIPAAARCRWPGERWWP